MVRILVRLCGGCGVLIYELRSLAVGFVLSILGAALLFLGQTGSFAGACIARLMG